MGWQGGATSDRLLPTPVRVPEEAPVEWEHGGTRAAAEAAAAAVAEARAAEGGVERRTFVEWERGSAGAGGGDGGGDGGGAGDGGGYGGGGGGGGGDGRSGSRGAVAVLVACGYQHSLVLTASGAAYTFGDSSDGRLGHGPGTGRVNEYLPRRVALARFLAPPQQTQAKAKARGSDVEAATAAAVAAAPVAPAASSSPPLPSWRVMLCHRPAFVHGSCGYYHTVLVSASGAVFACGAAKNGRLGLGPHSAAAAALGPAGAAAGNASTAESAESLGAGDGDAVWWFTEAPLPAPARGGSGAAVAAAAGGRGGAVGACAGDMHTLVALEGGGVLACGYGGGGRLGTGSAALETPFFELVPGLGVR